MHERLHASRWQLFKCIRIAHVQYYPGDIKALKKFIGFPILHGSYYALTGFNQVIDKISPHKSGSACDDNQDTSPKVARCHVDDWSLHEYINEGSVNSATLNAGEDAEIARAAAFDPAWLTCSDAQTCREIVQNG
jgi:hypothetical protein